MTATATTGPTRTKRTVTSTKSPNKNDNNGSILQPVLVGIIMVLLTVCVRYVREHSVNNVDKPPIITTSRSDTAPPPVNINPLDVVKEELARIDVNNGTGTRIVNSFVRDSDVLTQLANATLWEECANVMGTQWWDGSSSPASNIWQELARQIWSPWPETQQAAGYEYWCNVLSPTTGLEWHVDKDEELYASNNHQLSHPIMGAVYYGYPHSVVGGYLELHHQDALQSSEILLQDVERIRPEYNRLVILNVSKWHRVGEIQHGERYTFAVNIWKQKPEGL